MTLEEHMARHLDHQVGIALRLHQGRPVPGLYCLDCAKLIKWLSIDEADTLLKLGVEDIGMLPEEEKELRRLLK